MRSPSDTDPALRARWMEAVSDSLAATTEGTDYAEAPEPSDEPDSPYVTRLTNELISRLAAEAAPLDVIDVARLGEAFASVVAEADWVIVDYSAQGRKRQSIPYYRRRLMALVAREYAALAATSREGG